MSMKNEKDLESAREPIASEDQARRDFLKKAGRFAVVTPPAITLLLGTSPNSRAVAGSTGSGVKAVRVRRFEPRSQRPAWSKIAALNGRITGCVYDGTI
jgi:hypothetical protein